MREKARNTARPESIPTQVLVPEPCKKNRLQWFVYALLVAVIGVLTYIAFYAPSAAKEHVSSLFSATGTYTTQEEFVDADTMLLPEEEKFLTLKEEYLRDKKTFVEADLKAMKLTFYREGVETQTFDILTKGKEGSWWETPTGDYTILNKNPNGYSTIGKVWMPYSMQFYGNYLIHGWPYYEDGTEVSSSYSGGCIRLSTKDAGVLFDLVSVGTPLLVLEETKVTEPAELLSLAKAPVPGVSARAFAITNIETGDVLVQKASTEKMPVASLTKLMTAIVAHETMYLGRNLYVYEYMVGHETTGFKPVVGEAYNGLDLLYPLLMQSSNDTAKVFESAGGGERFIRNMNIKATALKMNDTKFADASGLSPDNISTAADIHKLLAHIYYKRPFVFDITKGKTFPNVGLITLGESIDIQNLKNFNEFAGDPDIVGVKNGQTLAAGETMASVWYLRGGEHRVPISIVVLGSTDREADTHALISWVRENYSVAE